jgi:dolichyl-phosphate beta-glucosyltransferase
MTTSVSLIIPAYNEAERLPLTLRCIQSYRQQNAGPSECIVVDDGSEDSTADVVIGFSSEHPWCCLHRLDAHTGKGAAVRAGMLQAKCDLVFFSYADLSASLANLTTALRLLSGDVDVVFGSRTHPDAKIVRRQPVSRRFAARLGNCLIRGLLRRAVHNA